MSIEVQLKQEQDILSSEIAYLSKELKVTKDELKITLRKLDSVEEELALRNIQLKEVKQKKTYSSEELKAEILAQRDQILGLAKENKALKEEARHYNRKID